MFIRLLSTLVVSQFVLQLVACTVYEVDTASNDTLSGSLSKAVNKDRGRVIKVDKRYEEAPVYIDYSKRNPVLRHDDEFDKEADYQKEDPFEQEVEFSDFEKLKKRQQAKRTVNSNQSSNPEDQAMSLW